MTILTTNIFFPLLEDCKLQLDFSLEKTINYSSLTKFLPVEMATLRNKSKMAALNKENREEQPGSILAQNSNVPRSQEVYITQVSDRIEGGVTKKLSEEFSRTKNCILGALSRLDDFLMNQLLQSYSGTAPEMSRHAFSTNQGTYGDNAQSDPLPEEGIFQNQTTRNSDPEDGHNMVLGVNEEVIYCSPSTTSRQQKRHCPTG